MRVCQLQLILSYTSLDSTRGPLTSMPKQQESIRTREQAAARLLDLSGHLSSSRFIHRPFDQTLRKPVMGGLEEIVGRLPELGYEVSFDSPDEGSRSLFAFRSQTLPFTNSSIPLYPPSLHYRSTQTFPSPPELQRPNSFSTQHSPFRPLLFPYLLHLPHLTDVSLLRFSTSSSTMLSTTKMHSIDDVL